MYDRLNIIVLLLTKAQKITDGVNDQRRGGDKTVSRSAREVYLSDLDKHDDFYCRSLRNLGK